MRTIRIYDNQPISINEEFILGEDGSNHVGRVLRMTPGESITVFNGLGVEYISKILEVTKKYVKVIPVEEVVRSTESPIRIHLGQVLSRGDKMDFTVQKAVELGVTEITPLVSTRCGVRLKDDRQEKKQDSLQKIVISACEQCGRTFVPTVNPIITLDEFLAQQTDDLKLTLNPYTDKKIKDLQQNNSYRLLVGPEGGFSDEEVNLAAQNGFQSVLLGPRILRTETAALVAISILQSAFGDI